MLARVVLVPRLPLRLQCDNQPAPDPACCLPASTARLTWLLLSSDMLRVAGWSVLWSGLGGRYRVVVGGLFVRCSRCSPEVAAPSPLCGWPPRSAA